MKTVKRYQGSGLGQKPALRQARAQRAFCDRSPGRSTSALADLRPRVRVRRTGAGALEGRRR